MPFYYLEYFRTQPLLGVAFLLQGLLTVWLLVDCRNRGQDQMWFWVILWFQPLGAWAYFVAVKLPQLRGHSAGPGLPGLGTLFQRRASLDELRYKAEHIPTLANRLALAQRLIEKGQYEEAVPPLREALKTEPDHGQILYSLALCHVRAGRPLEGIPHLDRLLGRDPRWSNYAGWHLLAEARAAAGDPAGALEACRGLARLAPTLQHHCLLAEHLLAAGHTGEARGLLERSLRDHDFAPTPIRRRNRRWASRARKLQKTVVSR
jgi:hypothetical protein